MEDFVVYLTTYDGHKHPPFYIGSTSLKRFQLGYLGTPKSIEWANIFKQEVKDNKHLYHCDILSIHSSREEALEYEREWQIAKDVINSDLYVNKNLANNGCFGKSQIGNLNPMFGISKNELTLKRIKEANTDKVTVFDKMQNIWKKVTTLEYKKNKNNYNTPKGKYNEKTTIATRERVKNKTHHFCNPEVQKLIHEKRKGNIFVSEHTKQILREKIKGRFQAWELSKFAGNNNWKYVFDFFKCYQEEGMIHGFTFHLRKKFKNRIFMQFPNFKNHEYWLNKLYIKFKKGWNPFEDIKFVDWMKNESM